ncbi:MAG: ADOP family duplicated permease, partial [Gemmatimonadota bacterium]|nr:ADOP family duplicated permease [Gemmatimonadota bacterium]
RATSDGATDVVLGFVSPNFFDALGVAPRLGRGLLPEEKGAGTPLVAILTDAVWRTAFGADPEVVGSTIRLDGEAYEVVGVMGPSFRFRIHQSLGDPTPPEIFVPFDFDIADMHVNEWGFSMAVMGRIAPGVPHDRALAELDQIASRLGERDWAQPGFRFAVGYLGGDLVAKARPLILLLMAGVAVVLAIVCANVATVFLARGVARQRDAAVQVALGAGRGRLAAGTAAETLLLALAGAVLGLPLAHLFVRALVAAVPSDLPRMDEVALDLRIGLLTLAAATAVGLVTAAAPSLLHRGTTADALRSAGSRTGLRTGAARAQKGLVAVQVALSTALLISVALIGRSMVRLFAVDGGFRAGEQITFTVQPGNENSTDAEILDFYAALTERLESLPGVRHVGRVTGLPLSTRASQHHLDLEAAPGATGDEDHDEPLIDRMVADEGYLEAAGMDLVDGRWFRDEDLLSGARVAVMDQVLADRFWPGGSPVGLRVSTPFDTVGFQVVGVVRQSRLYDLGADDRPQWWVPHTWATYRRMSIVVDGEPGNPDLADQIRTAVRAVDPTVAVSDLETMSGLVEDSLARWRFAVQIMGAFGLAALLLAVLGVYGVIAYTVERRTGELGIRMALGARSDAIQRMVLGQGVRLVAWGLLIGTVGAWASGRLLGSLLYGVTPRDPLSTALALGLLLGAAVVATVLPARRASRIPPTEAFRID